MAKTFNSGNAVKWAVTLGFPIVLLLIPCNDVYTLSMKLFLALTLAAILMFAFENLNQTVVSLLLPFLYVVLQIAPANVALSPWTQTVPWMMISRPDFGQRPPEHRPASSGWPTSASCSPAQVIPESFWASASPAWCST